MSAAEPAAALSASWLATSASLANLFDGGPNWEAFEDLVFSATTAELERFYQARDDGDGLGCPFIEDIDESRVRDACESFIRQHCGVGSRRGSVQFTAELVAQLSCATCPRTLNVPAKALHGCLTAWMYFVDDAVSHLSVRCSEAPWYPTLVLTLVEHQLSCWHSGLASAPVPTVPEICIPDIPPEVSDAVGPLFGLGGALHECATRLVSLATKHAAAGHWKSEVLHLSRELETSLRAKIEEAAFAPDAPESYLQRHAKTGHVRVCLELNLLMYTWQNDLSRRDLADLPPSLWTVAVDCANHAILRSNELCFVKDIGQPEESLMAVTIALLRSKGGHPISCSLSKAANHGMLLRNYAATKWGFWAVQQIVGDLRQDLLNLVETCREVERSVVGSVELPARTASTVLLSWAFGYHFLNAASKRYGGSFEALVEVLRGRMSGYTRVLQRRAQPRAAAV